jgi:hypothetical protein
LIRIQPVDKQGLEKNSNFFFWPVVFGVVAVAREKGFRTKISANKKVSISAHISGYRCGSKVIGTPLDSAT